MAAKKEKAAKSDKKGLKAPARGKRYASLESTVVESKLYPLSEAVKIVKQNAKAKFDETVEIALNLGIDPTQSDQTVRGMISMPNGLGKEVRVAVFAKDEKAKEAKAAGADIVGGEDLMELVQKGEINFDRCIATPDMMGIVGRIGKILGPRGLMPNPKLGTVTPDVTKAVKAAKSGQVEFKVEKAGVIHAGVGKASFEAKALEENIRALVDAVNKAKPSGVKGVYLKKVTISSTMGVGVKLDVATLAA